MGNGTCPCPCCRHCCPQLLKVQSVEGSNPVVLAGDSHNAWAHEIVDSQGNRWGALCELRPPIVADCLSEVTATSLPNCGPRLPACLPACLACPPACLGAAAGWVWSLTAPASPPPALLKTSTPASEQRCAAGCCCCTAAHNIANAGAASAARLACFPRACTACGHCHVWG